MPAQQTVLLVGGTGRTDAPVKFILMSSLFKPASTNMANVARFMCDLTTDPITWDDGRGSCL